MRYGLPQCKWQQGKMPRVFYGARETPLAGSTGARAAARGDFCLRIDKLPEHFRFFVVYDFDVIQAKIALFSIHNEILEKN